MDWKFVFREHNTKRYLVLWLILTGFCFGGCNSDVEKPKNNNEMKEEPIMQVKVTGEGEPILIVPGGLRGWTGWEGVISSLNAMNRKVYIVQPLNVQFGMENRGLPGSYSVTTESMALKSTLDSLGLTEPVDLVAWSFGGLISLDYILNHGGKFKTITLIEPASNWVVRAKGQTEKEKMEETAFYDKFRGEITENSFADFLQAAGILPPGMDPREIPKWKEWYAFRNSLKCLPLELTHNDDIKKLKSITTPVLLIKGTGSNPQMHCIVDELAAELTNARVIELDGGHAAHYVSMEAFLNELKKFHDSKVIED